MSRTLIAHVSLWATNGELVTLAPGDEPPEWAEGRLGEHCFAPEDAPDVEDVGAKTDINPKPADAPDFTTPAPRRGRPRK